ncbi:hypothetical protein M2124_001522 [Polynucleobacter sphagniphilus]|uniref:hypothetical protein n=1 Tax=Polynucleobacter sphagniphilus TaxID=1743169 RepID=UPI00247509B9|nr:hypothetical protein [Polynucleobacter sphagniphilus]MDH6155239.1 hypothetical protein [Polynucleobacter sphagniphilus]
MKNTKKLQIKTFKRFMKEEKETWYSLDLFSDMSKDEVIVRINELIPYIFKMLKNSNATIQVLPILDSEEE